MTGARRFKRAEELYHAALELPAGERDDFIARACGEDQELQREVKSLLGYAEEAKQLLEEPAAAAATQEVGSDPARRWVGRRIRGYEVLSPLGTGGMGEVYRAKDTTLGREVALKVLPEAFARDPERVSRFRREARLLASLNHPNIAAIYGLEEDDGQLFLALELVEGETLKERLERGALPIGEALEIAKQIALGLEVAHERGIVHRDLKPANVKLTPEGRVKVLDFGLARADAGHSASGSANEVRHSPALAHTGTQAGVILGTAAYMAPEQAEGREVDKRADIWSFGVVLFEMLTGRRPFTGETVSEILAGVMRDDPDWSALPGASPPSLRRLLRRCLQKAPRERLHDIADGRLELEEALSGAEGESGVPGPQRTATPPTWRRALPWGVAAALGVACLALALRSVPRPDVTLLDIAPPPGTRLWGRSFDTQPAVSPDGRTLAFSAWDSEGRVRIYVRRFDEGETRALAGTDGGTYPFWSPDSRFVGFFADGKLKKVGARGGAPVSLCVAPDGRGGSWSPRGVIVFTPQFDAPLHRVPDEGGESTPVTRLDSSSKDNSHRLPQFLPDGRHFLYLARAAGEVGDGHAVMVGSLDGKEGKLLLRSAVAATYASGHLLYLRGDTLLARSLDPKGLELTGEETALAQGVTLDRLYTFAVFSASPDGVLVYWTGQRQTRATLEWRDRDGTKLGRLGDPADYVEVSLSPDGTRAAIAIRDSHNEPDLWIYDISRDLRSRFTFTPNWDIAATWSPDGRNLAFTSWRNWQGDLYRAPLEDPGKAERLLESEEDQVAMAFSPDGRLLAFGQKGPETRSDIWVLPLYGAGEPRPFLETESNEDSGVFSPDGRWMAYVSDESERGEVYVTAFPGGGRKRQISTEGGTRPQWRADGRELFYQGLDGSLMAVAVEAIGTTLTAGATRRLFQMRPFPELSRSYSAMPDGQRFLVVTPVETEVSSPLTVVLNWPRLLND